MHKDESSKKQKSGDVIVAEIGRGGRTVAVGKNIIQIGNIIIPLWAVYAIMLILFGILGVILYPHVVSRLRPLALPAGYNIVIAEFSVTANADRSARNEAYQRADSLADAFKSRSDLLALIGEANPGQVNVLGPKYADAFQVADTSQADHDPPLMSPDISPDIDVMIYGELIRHSETNWELMPFFYVTEQAVERAPDLVGKYPLGASIRYDTANQASMRDLTIQLETRLTLLTQMITGLSYHMQLTKSGYCHAVWFFWSVIQEPTLQMDSDYCAMANVPVALFQEQKTQLTNQSSGQEIALLFLGHAYLQLSYEAFKDEQFDSESRQFLAKARQAHEKGMELNKAYLPLYTGLADVFFQEAVRVHERRCDQVTSDMMNSAFELYADVVKMSSSIDEANLYPLMSSHLGLARIYDWRFRCHATEKQADLVDMDIPNAAYHFDKVLELYAIYAGKSRVRMAIFAHLETATLWISAPDRLFTTEFARLEQVRQHLQRAYDLATASNSQALIEHVESDAWVSCYIKKKWNCGL